MKKLLAFDLDDTLSVTKSPISDRMSDILSKILHKYEIAIISGRSFEQIKTNVIQRLNISEEMLSKIHLMPTCGAKYYIFDANEKDWVLQYAENIPNDEVEKIIQIVEEETKKAGVWPENPIGNIIENRGTQITFAGTGSDAPADVKYSWAKEFKEAEEEARVKIAERLPDLEVRLGGMTSIDITRVGIDKAFGVLKLIENLKISGDEILYFGDRFTEGGNDYPVKIMGIDCLEVDCWESTAYALEGILAISE